MDAWFNKRPKGAMSDREWDVEEDSLAMPASQSTGV
jgi:hypothetical protein